MAKFYKFDFTKELKLLHPAAIKALQVAGRSNNHLVKLRKLRKRLDKISGDQTVFEKYKEDKNYSKKLEAEFTKELMDLLKAYAKVADILDEWKSMNNEFAKAMFAKLKQKYDTMR